MKELVAGQSWIYRPPQGFESSRMVVGAVVPMDDGLNLVCCSVRDAPRRADAGADERTNILFLPMTETAFRASVTEVDGPGEVPAEFSERFNQWVSDTRGRAAFTVPYSGSLEQMIELEFSKRERGHINGQSQKLIHEMGKLLASGLQTKTEPFPNNQVEFEEILNELRKLAPFDVFNRMVIGGFLDHPHGPDQQRCMECIYFLPHRSWCDLPELNLPVEPYWWCRLWKV